MRFGLELIRVEIELVLIERFFVLVDIARRDVEQVLLAVAFYKQQQNYTNYKRDSIHFASEF